MNTDTDSLPMNLKMRLSKKLKQDRVQIEEMTSAEMANLSDSVKKIAENTCYTVLRNLNLSKDKISKHIELTHNQHVESLSKARSQIKRACIIPYVSAFVLCLALCFGAWGFIEYLSDKIQNELIMIQNLNEQIEAKQQTLDSISKKAWGVDFKEDQNGKWIILPPGMSVESYMSEGERQALRLVPRSR